MLRNHDKKNHKNHFRWMKEPFQGFCMAMADSVPGVSGGSIAFLMGFYEKFITSLDDLTSRNKEKTLKAVRFLIKLGIGWIIGMGIAVTVLASVFENHIYEISSLFLGFVAVATILMLKEWEVAKKKNISDFICLIVGVALVAAVTRLNGISASNIDLKDLTLSGGIYVFFAAMIAISAMVLPGISGSTLLLIFGLYVPVITTVKDVLTLDFSGLPALVIFILGILTGIVVFVRWIKLAMQKFPSQTRYAIIGLMIGSFYAIVMGPATLDVPKAPMGISSFRPVFFCIGILLVIGLEWYKHSQERAVSRKKNPEVEHAR